MQIFESTEVVYLGIDYNPLCTIRRKGRRWIVVACDFRDQREAYFLTREEWTYEITVLVMLRMIGFRMGTTDTTSLG